MEYSYAEVDELVEDAAYVAYDVEEIDPKLYTIACGPTVKCNGRIEEVDNRTKVMRNISVEYYIAYHPFLGYIIILKDHLSEDYVNNRSPFEVCSWFLLIIIIIGLEKAFLGIFG